MECWAAETGVPRSPPPLPTTNTGCDDDMTVLYGLAVACVGVSVASAYLRNRKKEKARFIAKMTCTLLFCLIAFGAAYRRTAPMTMQAGLMLGALVLGAVGDIVLGLDAFVEPKNKIVMMLLGGIPFFFGHVLYIVLLLSYGQIRWPLLAVLPVVPAVFLLMDRFQVINLYKMLFPLTMYGLVLGGMMLATFNVAMQGGVLGRWMWFPGVLFTISDTSLFVNHFGGEALNKYKPLLSYTVMLPYYAAQSIFALTVMWL